MRSICPSNICECGAAIGLPLVTPIQLLPTNKVKYIPSTDILKMCEQGGIRLHPVTPIIAKGCDGICRHTKVAVNKKLKQLHTPDTDPNQEYY